MSKGINPVAQTYYKVVNIQHEAVTTPLNYTKPILTWLPDSISDKGKVSISLLELKKRLNSYKRHEAKGKINNSGFLKGLYTGYFVGENCTTPAPYLMFDIDVKNNDKKKENVHLFNPLNNDKVFKALAKIAVICWRSNSQNGIAGILYVPQIAQYTNETRELHKTVGESITSYLSELIHEATGVDKVEFDVAQSKFRQVRLIAEQTEARELNPHPFKFTYEVEKRIKRTSKGVVQYRDKNYTQPNGSISEQYNSNTPIFEVMLKYGFTEADKEKHKTVNTNKIRVKHSLSDSSTTGEIDTNLNVYFNYSESLGGTTSYTPARIVCYFEFDNDWQRFKEHLYSLNYKDKVTTPKELKTVTSSFKEALQQATPDEVDKIIFKHCFNLQHTTNEIKKQFIADNCVNPEHEKYFIEYLKLADYKIKYDEKFIIEKYVSEVLNDVLNLADKHNKIVLRAETGKGKTTAFVRDFHKHRPNSRLLILAPLTIIVEQNAKDYKGKGVFLTGKSNMNEKIEALKDKIVFATYEQGIKLLETTPFDYIVIDEIHQLITANSFKRDVIADLTPLLNDCKVIGLTGTTTQIFNKLDYKLIDVDVKHPVQTSIEVRYLNIKAFDIVMNHLSKKPKGKVLIRLNEIATIKELTKHLVKTKLYNKSEILFLHSTKEVKNSKEYKKLAHKREFYDNYKLIFTTSLIDEGLSIEQNGFSDVVFIETNYNPRPEPVKQFFARFRNEAPERKNYLYLRTKNNQQATRFNPETMFDNDLLTLEKETANNEAKEVLTTYNSLFSNNNFYYNNATVNPYYLAYAVTEVLFSYFNTAQFLEYLESNYNLSFTINKEFEVEKKKTNFGSYTKALKQQIAKLWIEANEQILQVLHYHTQNPRIRKATHPTQTRIEPDILEFAISNIKHFEQLFNRTHELTSLGVENPVNDLIKNNGEAPTLQSNDYYRKTVLFYRVENTLNEPITQADEKTAKQFISFAKWCNEKQTFSHKQMIQRLREIGVMNYKAFNEQMLFELLKGFNLNAKRNKKTNLINCTGLQGST